jgi:hypothetical protein
MSNVGQRRKLTDVTEHEKDERIILLETTLTQALGIIVEFGNLNGFRNMSNAELGKAVLGMAEHIADILMVTHER